ncbi:efflux RND transporter periplasmic adaptor subunit [Chromatiaceae bacterium AAb-1]|nr:efflux RND transporter periplasmic adaptor subunit [Chromatiaceae bacterium AAb-1]
MPKSVYFAVYGMGALLLSACSEPGQQQENTAPWVKTITVTAGQANDVSLSATIRARYEVPVSFQVSGRILTRHIDAGQTAEKGQVLFRLDPRDLQEALRASDAGVQVAEAALASARAELKRNRQLVDQRFISSQALERYELSEQEALANLNTARAQRQQALNALDYAELRAPDNGIMLSVNGEPGQFIAAGQAVATQALAGDLEAEIYFPQHITPPQNGQLEIGQLRIPAELRQISGAVDVFSRTWLTRYRLTEEHPSLALGAVVKAHFSLQQDNTDAFEVPVGAIDERGEGAQIWKIVEGTAQPVAVTVLSLSDEKARIQADIQAGTTIIALGTHLLTPGMAVRELQP